MQESQEYNFSQILDQSLYTYLPEKKMKQEVIMENGSACMQDDGKKVWSSSVKLGLVKRLRPIVMLIGVGEIVVGMALLVIVTSLACEYNKMYATEDSRLISLMSFGGLFVLVVSGMMLLIALELDVKKLMWNYILVATFLCVYTFVLSVMKIHFALLVIERAIYRATVLSERITSAPEHKGLMKEHVDTYAVILPENRHFLLSTAVVVGITTMLGSVIHFIGNVTVFTYYNLKYIQPILFNCGP